MTIFTRETVNAAESIFGENLLFAFVGGSYAKGTAKLHSDIDVFVTIKRPDRAAELKYAETLKLIHKHHSLEFDHYGQIIDSATLDLLIGYTIDLLPKLPSIQNVGCYHGDCILSIFRKGDVVLKILEEPKLYPAGDLRSIAFYEKIAVDFFSRHPMERKQLDKQNLAIKSLERIKLNRALRTADPECSPVGIGLERWFRAVPSNQYDIAKPSAEDLSVPRNGCPLDHSLPQITKRLYEGQCIGHDFDNKFNQW